MQAVKVDLAYFAKKVVNECLMIKPGENFWISCADPFYVEFAEECAVAAVEAGAYPFITMSSDRLGKVKLNQDRGYLLRPPAFAPRIIEVADAQLQLAFPRDPEYVKSIPPEKIAAASVGAKPVWDAMFRRNTGRANLRNSSLIIPTPEAAKRYGLTFEEYSDLIWGAVDIDYQALSQRAKKIAQILGKTDKIHIKTDDGTDLTFSIKGRVPQIDDGIMDMEDIEKGTYLQNLPTGEVYISPIETSAEGTAVFQYNIFMGEPLVNLKARFEKGQIVEMEADEGLEHYKGIMDQNTGNKYHIAELGIGLNPKVTDVIGDLALDEKIIGTVHIATGENRMMGGQNEASIHWDLVMKKPTLMADDTVIMEKGEYMI